jgi:hypothetical protein
MRSVESGFQRLVDGRACFLTGGAVVSVPFTVSDHSHGLSPLTVVRRGCFVSLLSPMTSSSAHRVQSCIRQDRHVREREPGLCSPRLISPPPAS